MNIRIFSASFGVPLLCVTLPANADIRPEIAHRLELAQRLADHYSLPAAFVQMRAVTYYKNETVEEKQAIAKTQAYIDSKRPENRAGFQDAYEDAFRPPPPPPNYGGTPK